ncbi:hypothetical protein PV05_08942 [Exophiala xenobiotica]|uniref:Uncharacterized protein n=1 Tax=Exophiala xenobiotica TaxID=348802 RepID=A0A0D2CTJ3_9EURO|nr:uncharacterized protein PV05_08942 [Exophiala xenobiotica]KIW53362.1 hypothetical protein PV05_08942 [Exophiala xenobiotica]
MEAQDLEISETHPPDGAETHRDLRSRRHAQNRCAKQSAKYYGYRGVHPSWIGQPYHSLASTPTSHTALEETYGPFSAIYPACGPLVSVPRHLKVSIWTKRDMFLDCETDIWPLDRRHHRGKKIREKRSAKWELRGLGRGMKVKARAVHDEVEVEDGQSEVHVPYPYYMEEQSYGGDGPGRLDKDEEAAGGEEVAEGAIVDAPERGPQSLDLVNGIDLDEDEVLEGLGFTMISERDFDVISISSKEEEDSECDIIGPG